MPDTGRREGTDVNETVKNLAEVVKRGAEEVERAADRIEREKQRWIEGTGPRPSRPLLGRLPVARVIPQDVHSVLDYGAAFLAAMPLALDVGVAPKLAGAMVAALQAGVSALTDYRLSVAKVIPIEAHEVVDHVSGVTQLVAPFVLGYDRRDRAATVLHVLGGALVVAVSLFTDYRAEKGIGGRLPEPS